MISGRTGYEIREGSRMLAERFARAEAERREAALQARLAVTKAGLVILNKQLEREIKAA